MSKFHALHALGLEVPMLIMLQTVIWKPLPFTKIVKECVGTINFMSFHNRDSQKQSQGWPYKCILENQMVSECFGFAELSAENVKVEQHGGLEALFSTLRYN